jgi:hypothetical protein
MFSFASRVSKGRGAKNASYLCNLETPENGVAQGGNGGGPEREREREEGEAGSRVRKSWAIEERSPHVCETELVK